MLKSSGCYPPWGLLSLPCVEDLGGVSGQPPSHPPERLLKVQDEGPSAAQGFPGGSDGKNLPAVQETCV